MTAGNDDADVAAGGGNMFAPKVFSRMLEQARRLPEANGGTPVYHFPNLPHSPRFTRVWVQGVVVWTDGVDDGDGRRCVERFALDDGTGPPLRIATPPSCHCATPKDPLTRRTPGVGDYVACVGFVTETNDTVGRGGGPNDGGTSREEKGEKNRQRVRRYALVAERVHDLSRSPGDAQREAMWNVEVPEAFKALEAAHDGGG